MDFWGTILVLLRRWYIALPAFVLAFAATAVVYVSRPILYTSSSVLVLTAPISGATEHTDPKYASDLTNPLLNFDQGLSDTAAILVQALSTPEMLDKLGVRPGGDPAFQVTNGSNNPELFINGPLVVITAQSTSPSKAQDLVVRVAQYARQNLMDRQQELKAPPSTYIVLFGVVSPTTPQVQRKTRLRPAISVLALGCIASVAAAFGAESIMTRPGRGQHAQSVVARRMAAAGVIDFGETGATPSLVAARLHSGLAVLDDERQV